MVRALPGSKPRLLWPRSSATSFSSVAVGADALLDDDPSDPAVPAVTRSRTTTGTPLSVHQRVLLLVRHFAVFAVADPAGAFAPGFGVLPG